MDNPRINNAVVIGHSFVSGLHDHFIDSFNRDGPHMRYSAYVAKELQVSNTINNVYLCGTPGAKITKDYKPPHVVLQEREPEIVIIDIGSNDICLTPAPTPTHIASSIIDLAKKLINEYAVNRVVIASLLYRDLVYTGTIESFGQKVYEINHNLIMSCDETDGMTYHKHKGFWRNPDNSLVDTFKWSADGIHPNNAEGRFKYKNSLKRALHDAARKVTNFN